jgi:redox-sensitive bicupin YhaK (pirin superfamily)
VRNLFPSGLAGDALGEPLSPFLLLDLAGPTRYSGTDTPRGVGEHPHRGFETGTIVYQGRVAHRDSAGNQGVVGPGDVQWMTAGAGVVHEELHERAFAREGGTIQMAQLWVNLPREHKLTAPRYQDLRADSIPEVEPDGRGGRRARVIAGALGPARGPAETFSELNVWDRRLAAGAEARFELPPGHNAGVAVFEGRATVNGSDEVGDASLAWLGQEGTGVEIAAAADSTLLLLSGRPLREPVVSHGPFVMTTGQEIYAALKDFQSGRLGRLESPPGPRQS